jgi:SPP1 gp7 family putative phage head morphogenesis protein
MSAPQPWRKVHAAGDARRERVRRLVLRLLSPSLPSLEGALATGRESDVITAFRKDTRALRESVTEGLRIEFLNILGAAGNVTVAFGIIRSIIRSASSAPIRVAERSPLGLDFNFNTSSPAAIKWAEDNAAELVTAITDEQMIQVRAIVINGFKDGKTPATLAREIRNVVGLTDPQARKFSRILEQEGKSKAFAYAKKARTQRSITIARTEVLKAANEGQRQAWSQARSAGLLTGQEARTWIVTYDERTCEICAPMDGQIVGLNEPFTLPDGSRVEGPPAHPRCRCGQGLTTRPRKRTITEPVSEAETVGVLA